MTRTERIALLERHIKGPFEPSRPLPPATSKAERKAGRRDAEQMGADPAMAYVGGQIAYLSAIKLTPEGRHALLCYKVMLRHVWHIDWKDGRFVPAEDG